MITAGQVRPVRALLGLDQRGLAELASLAAPTIERTEASVAQRTMASPMKLIGALSSARIERIRDRAASGAAARCVRLAVPPPQP
jgi:predicted transcriptional regulator